MLVERLTAQGAVGFFQVTGGGLHVEQAAQFSFADNRVAGNALGTEFDYSQVSQSSSAGGGMTTERIGTSTIRDNQIVDNLGVCEIHLVESDHFGHGGGIALITNEQSTFEGNQILRNTLFNTVTDSSESIPGPWPSGGGISLYCFRDEGVCRFQVNDNLVADNRSVESLNLTEGGPAAAQAGALMVGPQVTASLNANRIVRNRSAVDGPSENGALYTWKGEIQSTNDVIAYNSGGISVNTDGEPANLMVRNSTIVNNESAGIDSHGVAGTISVIIDHVRLMR